MLYVFYVILMVVVNLSQLYGQTEMMQNPQSPSLDIALQVVASKSPKKISDTAADITVINKEKLQESGYQSVSEALRSAGIVALDSTSTEKGTALYVRGLDIRYLLIVIDGQRVKDATLMLSKIPISSVEHIEIVRGAASYLWGADALAGVVYIRTKKGVKKKGFYGTIGKTYANTFENPTSHLVRPYIDLSYSTGNFVFYSGGSFDYGYRWRAPITAFRGQTYTNQQRDHGNFNIYSGFDVDFLDKHNIKLNFSYNQYTSPFLNPETKYVGFADVKNPGKILTANIAYNFYPIDKLDIKLSSGINFERNLRIFDLKTGDGDLEGWIANNTELLTVYSINDAFTLKSGYSLDFQRRTQLALDPENDMHYNNLNNSLFLGGDYKYRGKVDIDITLGGRYQYSRRDSTKGKYLGSLVSKSKDAHSFSPEFRMVIKPVSVFSWKLNVGHAFKAPDLEMTFRKDRGTSRGYAIGGNPNLTHENAWSYSTMLEYNPIPQLFLNFGLHRTDVFDLVQFKYTGEIFKRTLDSKTTEYNMKRPFNVARAYTWGISTAIINSLDIPYFGILSSSLQFEYNVAKELRTTNTGVYIDENGKHIENPDLENRPPLTLTGSLSWSHPKSGTSIAFSGYYFHNAYAYNRLSDGRNQLRRTGVQTTFDLRLSQKFMVNKRKQSTGVVFFEAKNLLNAVYDKNFDRYNDQTPRNFVVGFNVDF